MRELLGRFLAARARGAKANVTAKGVCGDGRGWTLANWAAVQPRSFPGLLLVLSRRESPRDTGEF
eukprot:13389271-Alexandrium_andersonii.AAC.1